MRMCAVGAGDVSAVLRLIDGPGGRDNSGLASLNGDDALKRRRGRAVRTGEKQRHHRETEKN